MATPKAETGSNNLVLAGAAAATAALASAIAFWLRQRSIARAEAKRRPDIVLVGDSLTQFGLGDGGWTARLADAYQRRADVINRGFSGYTTRAMLPLLRKRLLTTRTFSRARLVTVWLGANDAALPGLDQHVPLSEFEANLTEIVGLIHGQAPAGVRIVLITPTPVDEQAWLAFCKQRFGSSVERSNRSLSHTGEYARAVERVAGSLGVPALNLYKEMLETGDWQGLLRDGLHLSTSGNRFVFQQLQALIAREWPEFAVPDPAVAGAAPIPQLQPDAPFWANIDIKNPDRFFD